MSLEAVSYAWVTDRKISILGNYGSPSDFLGDTRKMLDSSITAALGAWKASMGK